MASFLDKMSEKSRDLAKKAKDLAEIASLKGQINSQEESINKRYMEIGKKYYEQSQDVVEDIYLDEIIKIREAIVKIAELNKAIQVIKGVKVCSECQAENGTESVFCSSCGAKITVEAEVVDSVEEAEAAEESDWAESDTKECPDCQYILSTNVEFCTNCGHKFE